MVVDDEAIIRMILADELSDAGFKVIEADGGDSAVHLLESGTAADVVVTDVRMPGQYDGLALARWMATHRPGVPVIVTSGYAVPAEVSATNGAIAAVLAKPYKSDEVVALVRRLAEIAA
jgi:DNA-binding NtrC family response regulator